MTGIELMRKGVSLGILETKLANKTITQKEFNKRYNDLLIPKKKKKLKKDELAVVEKFNSLFKD
jgi:hypothetical protein